MSGVLDRIKLPKNSPFVSKGLKSPQGYQVVMCNPNKAAASRYQMLILKDIFNLNNRQIFEAIVEAHVHQQSILLIGTREIAEMRALQAETMRRQYMPKSKSLKI